MLLFEVFPRIDFASCRVGCILLVIVGNKWAGNKFHKAETGQDPTQLPFKRIPFSLLTQFKFQHNVSSSFECFLQGRPVRVQQMNYSLTLIAYVYFFCSINWYFRQRGMWLNNNTFATIQNPSIEKLNTIAIWIRPNLKEVRRKWVFPWLKFLFKSQP